MRRALDELDRDDRTLIVLKHLEGYTYDELSLHLGIPRGTVMSRLFRARQRLRACVEVLDPTLIDSPARRSDA
jgi:RNA polymerase sigma-70 factor (ECF subfamily)